jgi:hypothetical protein
MTHARLTHPDRGELPFYQGQSDESSTQAVANIANELGVDRPSLVHTETREGERQIRARVTGPRRARNDPDTDDWQQALANYVDLLESHVDEFQGDGYTLVDDELDIEKQVILESVEWSLTPGQPYDLEYTANLVVGRGTFESESIDRRNPTVNDGMDVMLRVDGVDLPGFRDLQVSRSVGVSPNAVFDRDSAENNDAVLDEGVQQTLTFEGIHVGTPAERANAHDALDNLVATADPITLETRFPGYSLEGFVTAYGPTQESRFAGEMNHFAFEFVEGTRA